jgi:mono/diheme cytochrome c family protein
MLDRSSCSAARILAVALFAFVTLAPDRAPAYPGGTPDYQTDVAPFCASCHSSRAESVLAGSSERAAKEVATNKHLALVKAGAKVQNGAGYEGMSEADRATLIAQVEALDAASTVKVEAPAKVKAGETFAVKVSLTGGGGPVVGVGLVDAAHRWYARPASSAGWQVVAPPEIVGADGKSQTDWLAKRPEADGRNLSFVNVAVQSDAVKKTWGKAMVTFQLRAPSVAGSVPLAAVYFYGTEKSTPLGFVVDPKDALGRKSVRGGFGGGSGRVLFSDVAKITVE